VGIDLRVAIKGGVFWRSALKRKQRSAETEL
jgi:hypothetical protein